MFLPSSEPETPSEAGLAAFCPSLNSPVVSTEGLPRASARCAIAVYAGEYGGWALSVAVRSLQDGTWLVYGFQGDLADCTASQALETGLTFAEGMGFLFDEDWISTQGADARSRAVAHWQELTGAAPGPAASPAAAAVDDDLLLLDDEPFGDELPDSELLLDDLLAPQAAAPARGSEAPLRARPTARAAKPGPERGPRQRPGARPPEGATLSKFRRPAGAEPPRDEPQAEDAAGAPSPLGRISLVRRRVGSGTEAGGRMSSLLRLLTGF